MVTNTLGFAAVIALLISLNWWLGLITAAVFAPVLPVCLRFEKRYKVLSRRVQDQEGDLATLVEEAATGIRVLKALGRGPQAAVRHAPRPRRSTAIRSRKLACSGRSGRCST